MRFISSQIQSDEYKADNRPAITFSFFKWYFFHKKGDTGEALELKHLKDKKLNI